MERIKAELLSEGKEVPEDIKTGLFDRVPKIKFVAIVVDGVRR